MLAERVKEWTRDWENQGLQKGLQKGKATLLLKQVECKFGVVDEATRQRITAATSKQLERWGERILTAITLEEMLG